MELGQGKGWELEVLALNDRPCPETAGYSSQPALKVRGFGRKKGAFAWAALRTVRDKDSIFLGHIHFSVLALLLRLLAPHAVIRQLVYGIEVWHLLSWLTRRSLRQAVSIWSISDFTRRRMVALNPDIQDLRFEVLPCTLGPSQGAVPRGGPPAASSLKTLLCVSRLVASEQYKNVEQLIRSLPGVLDEIPETTLVIVGPGDDRPRLEAVVASLGLKDQVRFAGRVSDEELQAYYATCDLFVLPSTGEGFGIVYLEAMQHGKACIGARAAAVPEVIEDEVTGLLVDPEKPEQLSRAIIRLLQDDVLRQRMGEQGRQRFEEKFSMPAFRRRLEELLCR